MQDLPELLLLKVMHNLFTKEMNYLLKSIKKHLACVKSGFLLKNTVHATFYEYSIVQETHKLCLI